MVKDSLTLLSAGFAQPWALWLLFLLPLLTLGRAWVRRRRELALQVWLGELRLGGSRRRRQWLAPLAWYCGLVLLIVGCAGPQWGRDPEVPPALGRDIWIVLDVSRSMLAEDRASPPVPIPNRKGSWGDGYSRLDRAKRYLRELAEVLQKNGDYRLGLVVFAGQAKVLCPLTEDYEHFRFALAIAHPDRFGPAARLGYNDDGAGFGTSLRAALGLTAALHDPRLRGFEHVVLITDGDDLAGGWESAIGRLRQSGMAVHVLGVGDKEKDSYIPSGRPEEPFLMFDDEEGRRRVTTRRQDKLLEELAAAANGDYQPEEEDVRPLTTWFEREVASLAAREWTEDRRPLLKQQYGWFFAGALALFFVAIVRSDRPLAIEDR